MCKLYNQWRWNELKVGGTGCTRPMRSAGIFFGRAPPHFGSVSTISALVSAFVMVSTFWSVFCLPVVYLRCRRAQPFVKVEGGHVTCPRALWSRRNCLHTLLICSTTEQGPNLQRILQRNADKRKKDELTKNQGPI